jgi:hypothetical protein
MRWTIVCIGLMTVGLMIIMSTSPFGSVLAAPPTDATHSEPDSTMHGKGSGPSAETPTSPDKKTDLTGGKSGVPDEYSTTPVRQGKLHEVTDSKWLGQPVHGIQGDVVGTIKQVLKDQTTGQIEYVMLLPKDSKAPIPLRWSQFDEKKDQLQLKMKKEDLKTALNPSSTKDLSPDIQEYMSQIDQARSAPKASKGSGSTTSSPAVGPHGEADTTKGGPGGFQALPEGKAPGHEGGQPSSKR